MTGGGVVFRKIIVSLREAAKKQAGQAFILVLILLLVGGLILTPLLGFMGTGLKSGQVFEDKTSELYAADAGIEDGLWQIKYDELQSISDPSSYSMYDFTTEWNFELDNQVNGEDVSGTIKNVWIPKDLSPLDESAAQVVIGGEGGNPPKLLVTGSVPDTGSYKIKIAFNKEEDDDDLAVDKIGIWLPGGFEYVEDSSNLEQDSFAAYYKEPVVTPHAGGHAVIWDYSMLVFTEFPGVQSSDVPMETEVTFEFTSRRAGTNPEALSWIDTNFNLHNGITYTWDADTRVYKITSQAGETELEAYTAKSEMRELGGAIAGDYRAIGNSLMRNDYGGTTPVVQDTLLAEADATVGDIPVTAEVQGAYLYWSGWLEEELEIGGGEDIIFEDNCAYFTNWDRGDNWQEAMSYNAFYVHNTGDEILTLHSSLPLEDYSEDVVTIAWQNWTYRDYQESGDCFQYAFYNAGGWGDWNTTYCGNFGTSPVAFSTAIPTEYLTDDFKVRFRVLGFSDYNEYCYINDVVVSASDAVFSDDCADFSAPVVSWSNDSDWVSSSGTFKGHHGSGSRYLTMSSNVDLSAYSDETLVVAWDQWEELYSQLEDSDRLYFAFSGDGGSSWSSNIEAFRDDIGSTPQSYFCPIPTEYLTAGFRLRFYLDYFGGDNENCYIDNIAIYETEGQPWADTSVIFKIDGTQVYFDDDGLPQMGAEEIVASAHTTLENQAGEYSYACYRDVTELVQAFSAEEEEDGNHPGNGTYTVGGVEGDTGDEWSYAAWSLIIIYSSPETRGHQIYLYDDFIYSAMNNNVDFDGDGEDGGIISGFLVPEQITGEGNEDDAAKLTCFVGEGDDYYNYDYIKFNDTALSDGKSTNDVWNSWSVGLSEDGIDIDTFHVTWGSGLLEPGDTSAEVDLPTQTDSWNLVYIILSFRSETTAGGTISYLIRG